MRVFALILLMAALTPGPSPAIPPARSEPALAPQKATSFSAPSQGQVPPTVDQLVATLPVEEKVGQLLLLGFEGEDASNARTALADLRAGGIVLLNNGNAAPAVRDLIRDLRGEARVSGLLPPLVAIDHEGGPVQRIRIGVSQLGSNWELGQIQPLQQAVQAACNRGTVHGQELAAIGINLNLAPVLDVWDNPVNTVIGTRSYSADPERVALLGSAYISALQQAGTGATGKHFPGHGSTVEDSHLRLPVLLHDRARLDEVELVPFRAAIRAGVVAIMTAHISLPLIDTSSERPATMSPVILTGLLRGELGYDGLILTDDLGAMAAVSDAYSPGQAAVEAISAGADMLTISGPLASQVAARDALLAAVGKQITETRLDESVRHVLAAKQQMGLVAGPALEAPTTTVCG